MTAKEIRESGLLEQYAMGVLSDQEVKKVEGYLAQFPELQKDYQEIQQALQALATERSMKPRPSLEDEIVKSVMENSKPQDGVKEDNVANSGGSSLWKWISGLLVVCTLGALYFYWDTNTRLTETSEELNVLKTECDSISTSQQEALDLFDKLNAKENRILNFTPTNGYPETQLMFHFNPVEKQNYIQVQNLPAIADNQAFQLWSLKGNSDPIPLTVFKVGADFIVPVAFEEGTGTYAITIEDESGALVPTLSRLIGTVSV